jgi:UDP-galactopyranose mutase
MQKWLDENQVKYETPKNAEEAAKARVGEILYEKMFKHYTKKQWDKYPEELDASVTQRIPVRNNFDDRYFSDKYQYLPEGGYTQMFEKIFDHPNIRVMLNTDYFDVRGELEKHGYEKLFYTGPIDRFFEFKHSLQERLEYRSINFVFETHDKEQYQEAAVINYPGPEEEFTRIVEYKHMTKQKHAKTVISKEYTVDVTSKDQEPYYPVPNERNQKLYEKYKEDAEKLTNVYFVGRLANYKYFNMDQAFKAALDLFAKLEAEDKVKAEKKSVATKKGITKKKSPWIPKRQYEYEDYPSKYASNYQAAFMKHEDEAEN